MFFSFASKWKPTDGNSYVYNLFSFPESEAVIPRGFRVLSLGFSTQVFPFPESQAERYSGFGLLGVFCSDGGRYLSRM